MFPVLLRLLLCLCLLVDTVAPAVAGTHLALAAAAEGEAIALADGASHTMGADCHETEDAPAQPQSPANPDPRDEDCLQRCLDLCLQHGFAAFATTVAAPAIVPAREPAHVARVPLHDAPAFPPLRPPIA